MSAIVDEFDSNDQASAICHSMWKEDKKSNMTPHELLLKAIRQRQEKKTAFNFGILTADRYVTTLQDCVGIDACNKFISKGMTSFHDIIQKASNTLTYNNPDMILEEVTGRQQWGDSDSKGYKQIALSSPLPDGVELPKNTLMVFRHVLTTPRKDRDGDILRTQGARVDPKMLLLWQHVHTLPIGLMLATVEHSSKVLSLISAIVDMNELCHDAAVMIDNKMGRFSHGFKAVEFEDMKEEEGETTSPGGFDVKRFEILEESLVSVPANIDSETEEVLLSLVEGGKLTSPLMKKFGKSVRSKRPVSSSVKYRQVFGDFEETIETLNVADFKTVFEETRYENKSRSRSTKTEGTGKECGCGSTSKETNENSEEEKNSQVEKMIFYGGMISGSWEYVEHKLRDQSKKWLLSKGIELGEYSWITVVATFADHAIICHEKNNDDVDYYKSNWTMVDEEPAFIGELKEVLIETTTEIREKMLREKDGEDRSYKKIDSKEAMAIFLAEASSEEIISMSKSLSAIIEVGQKADRIKKFRTLVGAK